MYQSTVKYVTPTQLNQPEIVILALFLFETSEVNLWMNVLCFSKVIDVRKRSENTQKALIWGLKANILLETQIKEHSEGKRCSIMANKMSVRCSLLVTLKLISYRHIALLQHFSLKPRIDFLDLFWDGFSYFLSLDPFSQLKCNLRLKVWLLKALVETSCDSPVFYI